MRVQPLFLILKTSYQQVFRNMLPFLENMGENVLGADLLSRHRGHEGNAGGLILFTNHSEHIFFYIDFQNIPPFCNVCDQILDFWPIKISNYVTKNKCFYCLGPKLSYEYFCFCNILQNIP